MINASNTSIVANTHQYFAANVLKTCTIRKLASWLISTKSRKCGNSKSRIMAWTRSSSTSAMMEHRSHVSLKNRNGSLRIRFSKSRKLVESKSKMQGICKKKKSRKHYSRIILACLMTSNSQTLASQESNLMLHSSMGKGHRTDRSSTSSAK